MSDRLLYLAGLITENEMKEKEEEKSGIDFDKDQEVGESKSHKQKVENSFQKNIDFFEKRRAGAAKIAKTAHDKGGPSILTFYHFDAKDKQYEDVLKAIKNGKSHDWFKVKYDAIMNKLHKTKFQQESFQRVVGELEVWGEAISQLF